MRSHDDFELVAAAAAGELEAFGELVRRHQDFVYGAVLRVVRNPTLAEDISQDCFLRAYRALPDFRGDSQVRSWLYRIAHNLALNAVTRRREYPTDTSPKRWPQLSPARSVRRKFRISPERWAKRSTSSPRTSANPWCCASCSTCPMRTSPVNSTFRSIRSGPGYSERDVPFRFT